MGLSHPICSKVLWNWGNEHFTVGVATMQGPRKTLEDAHVVRLVGQVTDEGGGSGGGGGSVRKTNTEEEEDAKGLNATMAANSPNRKKNRKVSLNATHGKTQPLPAGLLPASERLNTPNHGGDGSGRLLVGVFDGHGGDQVAKYLNNAIPAMVAGLRDLSKKTVTKSMIDIDQQYFSTTESTDLKNVGSTCTFAVITPPSHSPAGCFSLKKNKSVTHYQIDIAHIGDCRAILYNHEQDTWEQLTRDHRPDDPKELERITKAGAVVLDQRVDGKLTVTRSIGDWQLKNIPNVSPDRQKVIPIPDIEQRFASEHDFLLICCDGIFEKMDTDKAVEIVKQNLYHHPDGTFDPCAALIKLFDAAQESKSTDNMTGILLVFQDGSAYHKEKPKFDVGKLFIEDRMFLQFGVKFARAYGFEKEFKEAVKKEQEELFKRKSNGEDVKAEVDWKDIPDEDEQEKSMTFNSEYDFAEAATSPKRVTTQEILEEDEENEET